jgi:hypothetical protein
MHHWRNYYTDKPPTGEEALAEPSRPFHKRMRHDGCGGRTEKAELLTGIDGVSSRPVRRIVLRG